MMKAPEIRFLSGEFAFSRNCLVFLLLLINLFPTTIHAQLPTFTLTLSKTDETCLGNGTITFTVTGNNPLATMEYRVYQFPDLANPIALQTANIITGRSSGTYRVTATQILAGQISNSQSADITIVNVIVPLNYDLSSTDVICGDDGSITATITSGTGALYEIINGPVIRPIQTSPVFVSLPPGVYEVRVFNDCGDAVVKTRTVLASDVQLVIGPVGFPDSQLPDCNSITVANTITGPPDTVVSFPITLEYTIYPPNGAAPITIITTAPGSPAKTVIPLYYDQQYTYSVKVTDNCGTIYERADNVVNQKLTVLLGPATAKCDKYFLQVIPDNFVNPVTVTFTSIEPGFDPIIYNVGHPGPFVVDEYVSYGEFEFAVPFGYYAVSITDGCGRTATDDVTLIDEPVEPEASFTPYPGCDSNISIVEIIISGVKIVGGTLQIAPIDYPPGTPQDLAAFVNEDGEMVIPSMITGDYVAELLDECGVVHVFPFFVPVGVPGVTWSSRPDCEIGKGTLRIRGNSTNLLSIEMTDAPGGFLETLPYDASVHLTSSGIFSVAGLLPGQYSFDALDSCGKINTVNVTVPGYAITENNFELIPHCGSFDIDLNHVANGDVGEGFWLQEYDPTNNIWGHPLTGIAYTDGTTPNALNSVLLENEEITYSLSYLGLFRIIKVFESFENGEVGEFKTCIEIIEEFEFTGELSITGFQKVSCEGASADVKVLVDGVPPFIYKIISKNGQPFLIENNGNNVFANLEPATYTFWVQHTCGDIVVGDTDVAELPAVAVAHQADDLVLCDDNLNDGAEVFDLYQQNPFVLNGQLSADFDVTYHLLESDATLGLNPLPQNYLSENKTIFVRITFLANPTCFDVSSFKLIVNPHPVLNMKKVWGLCENATVNIVADSGFSSYLWSTGETSQQITVNTAGTYTLTVKKTYPSGVCSGTFAIEAIQSNAPKIRQVDTSDWTENNNSINVQLESDGIGNYTYSIDNANFQQSNVFTNLPPGPYTIFVRDEYGCGFDSEDVFLLTYPRFFTPNGDGYQDFWKVKFSETEPQMLTYIFDRYGKLITGFGTDSQGWDGTLNGRRLPSTDYWFLVLREDGRHLRGHFSMKR